MHRSSSIPFVMSETLGPVPARGKETTATHAYQETRVSGSHHRGRMSPRSSTPLDDLGGRSTYGIDFCLGLQLKWRQ